jgi:TRAP-type C4-dicarboxylate transport system substrate-binding protein
MKKINLLLIVCVLMLIISPLYGAGQQTESKTNQEVYLMRFSHGLPPDHIWAKTLAEFARRAEEKSEGQIKIEIYPAGQLMSDAEAYEAVMNGMVEIGNIWIANLEPNITIIGAFAPAGSVFNQELETELIKLYGNGEGPANEMAKIVEDQGVKILAWFSTGCAGELSGYFGTGKPIVVPSDLEGRKVRSLGPLNAEILSAARGRPVYLPGADLYTGLQRKTIDAAWGTPSHLIDRKLYEVTDWYTAGAPGADLQQFYPCMSTAYFNSLPEDVQDALLEAGKEMTLECLDVNSDFNPYKANYAYTKELQEMGFKIIKVTSDDLQQWSELCNPFHAAQMKKVGPEAIKIYNEISTMKKERGLPFYFIEE